MTGSARTFSMSDQRAFAAASGDANPLHLDELAARRTQAGAPVVHGIHSTLWALESLAASGLDLGRVTSLKVRFEKLLFPGRRVSVTTSGAPPTLKVKLSAGDLSILKIEAELDRPWELSDELASRDLPGVEVPPLARDLSIDEMPAQQGWLLPPEGAQARIAALFPRACSALGADRVLAIAMLSTVVGMCCPGLHSIFSGVTIGLGALPSERKGVGYRCVRADDRFRLVAVRCVARDLTAEISAFVRAEPVRVPGLSEVAARVQPGEFAGRRALIIGGSRGLGAATAKLVAAGGGVSVVTYVRGRAEANEVAEEIRAARGPEACAVMAYDVRRPAVGQLDELSGPVTDLFYFATPKMLRQVSAVHDRPQLREFLTYYVDGFYDLCRTLLAGAAAEQLSVLYPSAAAVVERGRDMTDYAIAKAAGEVLCVDLARAYPRLRLTMPRIPRVLTDQTAAVPQVEASDAVTVMLCILRGEPIDSMGRGAEASRTVRSLA